MHKTGCFVQSCLGCDATVPKTPENGQSYVFHASRAGFTLERSSGGTRKGPDRQGWLLFAACFPRHDGPPSWRVAPSWSLPKPDQRKRGRAAYGWKRYRVVRVVCAVACMSGTRLEVAPERPVNQRVRV